jgi:hypothetical protein
MTTTMECLRAAVEGLASDDAEALSATALVSNLVDLRRAIDGLEREWLRRAVLAGRRAE